MSILKPRGLQRSDKPAEVEGNIRDWCADNAAPFANQTITLKTRLASLHPW